MDISDSCKRSLSAGLVINCNSNGWGPFCGEALTTFDDMPYTHFDKYTKTNRVADFSAYAMSSSGADGTTRGGKEMNKYQLRQQKMRDDMQTEFLFKHDAADDSSFQLVDNTSKSQTKKYGNSNTQRQNQQQQHQQAMQGSKGGRSMGHMNQQQQHYQAQRALKNEGNKQNAGQNRSYQNRRPESKRLERLASLNVEGSWTMVEEFDLTQLTKLSTNNPAVEDLAWAGSLSQYDESMDRVSTRSVAKLKRTAKKFYSVTTTDDPLIEKFAMEKVGNVFATDAILSSLMAAPRSVYGWDLVVQKMDGMLFFDKREDAADLLTVSETANETPVYLPDDVDPINLPAKLSVEATIINQNYSQQILKPGTRKNFEPNPFFDEDAEEEGDDEDEEGGNKGPSEPADTCYRYRKFSLGGITLVARTEIHGYMKKAVGTNTAAAVMNIGGGAKKNALSSAMATKNAAAKTEESTEDTYFTTFAFNEWDSKFCNGINWRMKLDSQKSAVLATELKNNSNKLAKWTAQSMLAGADTMRFGYVSRNVVTNNFNHSILSTQNFKPKDLATQLSLQTTNMWGIVKTISELILNQPDGKYILLKDPTKAAIRLYSVPFEEESSDDDSSEEESDEEESGDDDDEDDDDEDE
jgi:translation initiation factor 3 subunit D